LFLAVGLGVIALEVVCLLALLHKGPSHRLEVTTYFSNAHGLRVGAPVRVAGIDVGKVTDVIVSPDNRDEPARVTMFLRTDDELHIPNDSKVVLSTAGILGETYILVDVAGASGPPVSNRDTLKSVESPELNYPQMLDKLTEALKNLNCDDVRAAKSEVPDRKH